MRDRPSGHRDGELLSLLGAMDDVTNVVASLLLLDRGQRKYSAEVLPGSPGSAQPAASSRCSVVADPVTDPPCPEGADLACSLRAGVGAKQGREWLAVAEHDR